MEASDRGRDSIPRPRNRTQFAFDNLSPWLLGMSRGQVTKEAKVQLIQIGKNLRTLSVAILAPTTIACFTLKLFVTHSFDQTTPKCSCVSTEACYFETPNTSMIAFLTQGIHLVLAVDDRPLVAIVNWCPEVPRNKSIVF